MVKLKVYAWSDGVYHHDPIIVSTLNVAALLLPPLPSKRPYAAIPQPESMGPNEGRQISLASNEFYYLAFTINPQHVRRGLASDLILDALRLPNPVPIEQFKGKSGVVRYQLAREIAEKFDAFENACIGCTEL